MFEQITIREITTRHSDGSVWAERWQLACGIWWLISRQLVCEPQISTPGATRLLRFPRAHH